MHPHEVRDIKRCYIYTVLKYMTNKITIPKAKGLHKNKHTNNSRTKQTNPSLTMILLRHYLFEHIIRTTRRENEDGIFKGLQRSSFSYV